MSKRKNREVRIARACKPGSVACWVKTVSRKSDELIAVLKKKPGGDTALLRRQVVNIDQELVFVERTRHSKCREPWLAIGLEGSMVSGVGIRKLPSGSLKFRRARATGLMFEPSGRIATPPRAPFMPPNNRPRAAGDLSLVRGGSLQWRRNRPRLTSCKAVDLARPLIRAKEKQLIFPDWSSERESELILFEVGALLARFV